MDISTWIYQKKYFWEFINNFEKLVIQYINNNTPTFTTKILDYVFVPVDYEIANVEVIKNQSINQLSDHRPLLVKVKKRTYFFSEINFNIEKELFISLFIKI